MSWPWYGEYHSDGSAARRPARASTYEAMAFNREKFDSVPCPDADAISDGVAELNIRMLKIWQVAGELGVQRMKDDWDRRTEELPEGTRARSTASLVWRLAEWRMRRTS